MSVRFPRAPIRWGLLPLAIVGGVIGAFVRGVLTLPFPGAFGAIPMVMAINVAGAGLLGLTVGWIGDRARPRTFFGTGMLGGFTSYSALAPWLAVDAANLVTAAVHGHIVTLVLGALAVLAVAVVLPVAAAAGGFAVGIRLSRRRSG